jgi:hypothetical protein
MGQQGLISAIVPQDSTAPFRARNIDITNGNYYIWYCYYGTGALTTQDNNYLIPLYIVGYKKKLVEEVN